MRCCRGILVVVVVRVWPVGLPALRPVNSLQHPADILAEFCLALLQQRSCHHFDCCEVVSETVCDVESDAVCEILSEAVCGVLCDAVCEYLSEAVYEVMWDAVCEVVCEIVGLKPSVKLCEAVCEVSCLRLSLRLCLRLSVRVSVRLSVSLCGTLSFCEAVCAIERHVARHKFLKGIQSSTDCGAADR